MTRWMISKKIKKKADGCGKVQQWKDNKKTKIFIYYHINNTTSNNDDV